MPSPLNSSTVMNLFSVVNAPSMTVPIISVSGTSFIIIFNFKDHAVDIKRRNKNIEFDPLQLPCGPDCYLKNDSSFSSTVFIPHERSLIDLMVESSDWCTIAMAIQLCTQPGEKAKTCRDVYEYVRKNHKDIVDARLLQSQVKRQKEK